MLNPCYEKELNIVLDKANNAPTERVEAKIGNVSYKLISDAKNNEVHLSSEYYHNIDVSGARHSLIHHGKSGKLEKRGIQVPVYDEDFKLIPKIIYYYDSISFGETDSKNTPLIKYVKVFSDIVIYYVEEIRTGKKTLTIKTMYKKRR